MENTQLWSTTGRTDYEWVCCKKEESNESNFIEIYYLVEGTLEHESIRSISRLKYRFIDYEEASSYYNEVRKLFPSSFIRLIKIVSQSMREFSCP